MSASLVSGSAGPAFSSAVFEVADNFATLGQRIHKSAVSEAHGDASLQDVSDERHVFI